MDTWFLDNLEKLVPIVIALLYFLGTSRAKKNEEAAEGPDPEADERARKIQEEIRRKILERQQKGNAPVQRESPPELPNVEEAPPLYPKVEPASRRTSRSESYPQTRPSEPPPIPQEKNPMEIFEEERRKVEEKLRKSRELAAKIRASDKGTAYERPVSVQRQKDLDRHRYMDLMDELDDPISLRKAILLKEILDRPVALR